MQGELFEAAPGGTAPRKNIQADLFCDLRLIFETVEEIAQRTGRPLEGLKERLISIAKSGQLFTIKLERTRYFKIL